jgi:hypothetical protein
MNDGYRPTAWKRRGDTLKGASYGQINADDEPLYDQAAIDAAVAAERERCAKICEGNAPDAPSYFEIAERLRECAAEIRRA